MGARYAFVSRWAVPAAPERCWAELERMLRPAAVPWWPAVRIDEAPPALVTGARIGLVVRSPLGYRLRMRLTVTSVAPGRGVAVASSGDLAGTGGLDVAAAADGSVLTWTWRVETEKPWMNAAAWVLRRPFEAAHARVMRRGEAGLRAALTRD